MTNKPLTNPSKLYALGYTTQEILAYADNCKKFVKDLGNHTKTANTPKDQDTKPAKKNNHRAH